MTGQSLDDTKRLAELVDTGLLDVRDDESFNRYARIATALLKVPVSLVSLVTNDRQHFPGLHGLTGPIAEKAETPLSHSFCKHVVLSSEPLIVPDARVDPVLKDNLAVTEFQVIAYLGVPLRTARGNILGSFCAIDTKPKEWTDEEIKHINDLGHLVTREIELRRIGRELKQANQKLQEEEEKNDEMVQMILHDLRNPLYGIIGGLSFFNDCQSLSNDDKMALEICNDASVQMERLLEQILQTHKLRLTDIQIQRSEVELEPLAEDVMDQASLAARAKCITLSTDLSKAPKTLNVDRGLLERILQNLLNNALKFTPNNGKISLRILRDDKISGAIFEVCDNGPGISEKEASIIFDRYTSGESGLKSTVVSIGLGLAFCKAAIDAHEGKIWVDSKPDKGSTFRFTLPNSLK